MGRLYMNIPNRFANRRSQHSYAVALSVALLWVKVESQATLSCWGGGRSHWGVLLPWGGGVCQVAST